jgi:8-oxo-dGTP pyrophosphatase MutT (NUDIX family)
VLVAAAMVLQAGRRAEGGAGLMQRAEITLWCPEGLDRRDVSVDLSPSHDRCRLQSACEDQIGSTWEARLALNPRLYNGSKFRLAGFEFGEPGTQKQVKLLLGVTDYKDYLGTNLSPQWQTLLALDSVCPPRSGHGGRKVAMLVPAHGTARDCETVQCATHEEKEADARTGTCLANTIGNAAVVETADCHVIYLKRSSDVGECPNMMVLPGGHAEPSALGLDSQEAWHAAAEAGRPAPRSDAVVDVLWDAMLLEVEEETGIPREALSEPRLLGFSRRVENHRTCMNFLVATQLSAGEVLERYRASHVQDRFESVSLKSCPRLELLSHVLPASGNAPSEVKGGGGRGVSEVGESGGGGGGQRGGGGGADHCFPGCHVGAFMLYREHLRRAGLC